MSAPTDPFGRLAPVMRLAPAKLNLSLAVVGRRGDGFHDLHSVFVPLGLADVLSLAPAGGPTDSLHVTGYDPGPPDTNTVLRALAATRAAVGGEWPGGPGPAPGLAARLEKRIPVAAGLAGGSSDGAAAIDGALEAWAATISPAAAHHLAASIGSDVPFFAVGGPALVEGRGERVAALDGLHGHPAVLLITPDAAISTRDAFAVFDATRGSESGSGDGSVRASSVHLAEELRSGLSAADLVARAGVLAMANDLLPAAAAILPGLVPFRRALGRRLGRPIGLSGSGPTLWALYASEVEASAAAADVRDEIASGTIVPPGDAAPSIVATPIITRRNEGNAGS